MLKKSFLPLVLGLLMAATAACSQQPPAGGPPPGDGHGPPKAEDIISRLDTDKDGVISKSEAAADSRFAEHFDTIDADHDGKITTAELTDAFSKMKPPAPPQQ